MLRGRDDARRCGALRHRSVRNAVPSQPAPKRSDDRGRHAVQQDGAGAAQGVRPDARAAVGDLHGLVRQRRRLLPLQLLRGARLRPHRAGGCLRAGLPAHRGGIAVRGHPAAAEDPPHPDDREGLMTPITPFAVDPAALKDTLANALGELAKRVELALNEVTVTVTPENYLAAA